MPDETVKMRNKNVLDRLFSKDANLQKEAAEGMNGYVQRFANEQGIMRKVMNPEPVDYKDLVYVPDREEPVIVYPLEPDQTKAVNIGFNSEPETREIVGERDIAVFQNFSTELHTKPKHMLYTYDIDIREITTKADAKQILRWEDVTAFTQIDAILGSAGSTVSAADAVMHQNIAESSLTPTAWRDAMKIMKNGKSHFQPETVVINYKMVEDLEVWGQDSLGEGIQAEFTDKGFARKDFHGKNLIITIKDDIVADDEIYMFANPNTLGKFYVLEDITMFPDARRNQLEWSSEEIIAMSIQPLGLAKATLNG